MCPLDDCIRFLEIQLAEISREQNLSYLNDTQEMAENSSLKTDPFGIHFGSTLKDLRVQPGGAAKTWSSLVQAFAGGFSLIVGLRIPFQNRRQSSSLATVNKPALPRQAVANHRHLLESSTLGLVLQTLTRCSPCRRSPRCVAASHGEASSEGADQVITGAHRQAHRRCPRCHPLVCRLQAHGLKGKSQC